MLNYFNFKKFGDDYLITNDLGYYSFLSENDFKKLVCDHITPIDKKYNELIDKGFIYFDNEEVFLEKFKLQMGQSKKYLFSATSLHIFVVTNICNMNCVYCQAQSNMQSGKGLMTKETAKKAVDIALSSNSKYLTFEFQGGEPLVNYEVIKYIVNYSEEVNVGKIIEYNIVSNLTLLDDEMTEFFSEHKVNISTSVDGNEFVHNKNRPYLNGKNTYKDVEKNLKIIQEKGICSGAVQTTTRYSLKNYKEIVDNYIYLGLQSIFIRPLTPLGFAHDHWAEIGYSTDEFLEFYRKGIEYLMQINLKGTYCSEGHATIFLKKILCQDPVNYMELRSPCGAGTGQLAYYYDGQVFACDGARMIYEMGDPSFKFGTVNDRYSDLINSDTCHAICSASVLESIQSCCDCVYQPFCGICTVINLAMGNNIFPKTPNDYKCRIYGGMLDILFEIIKRNDPDEMRVLGSWI